MSTYYIPRQGGNATFNTVSADLIQNNSLTRFVMVDSNGKFYYSTSGGSGTVVSASHAEESDYAISASHAEVSDIALLANQATTANFSTYANEATTAITASYALSASNALTASYIFCQIDLGFY